MVKEDRMRLACIRAPEDDQVRVLDLLVRARPSARAENRRQTDDARRVSGAVAAVDVVAADDAARELLREIVHFVRRLRAAEHPEAPRAVALDDRAEPGGGAIERLVPARRAEHAVVANQRFREPRI